MKKNLDSLGNVSVFLSLLCAIHCAATPILVGVVSLMGIGFVMDPFWEVCLLIISNLLAVVALFSSFRNHRKTLPFILFGLSLLLIVPGLVIHQHLLIFPGVLLTAAALLLNWRYSKQAGCAHSHA